MSLTMRSRVFADVLILGEVVPLAGRELGLQRQMGHADDAVHGRTDFVAHVGEKIALGA